MLASKSGHMTFVLSVLTVLLVLNGCGEPKPKTVAVPDVVGQSHGEAASAIMDASLYINTPSEQHSDAVKAGHVIHQTPAAGEPVPPGAIISLVISLGPSAPDPEETSATGTETDTATDGNPDKKDTKPE